MNEELFFSDKELIEAIWINYPENREIREKLALDKWRELYTGDAGIKEESKLSETLDILNVFKEFSVGNEKLVNKLLKSFFLKVREKYNPILIEGEKEELREAKAQESQDRESKIDEMWQGIQEEVEEEFQLEYEKMKRIMEIFDDVSLFAQVGWDLTQFSREDMFVISKLNEIFENREEIKRLLDNIGKVEKVEENNKRDYNRHYNNGATEVMGIKLGSDLNNLLPSELSLLHNPVLKKYFYIKYAESRLFTYDLKGFEDEKRRSKKRKRGKGPIIMCIDNSSSMEGNPEELAKGSALYILKKAYKEGRKVYLISFGSEGETTEYNLTNEKNGLYYALAFLRKKFFGGTDFITPLKRSIELIKSQEYKDADLLFITDGLGAIPKSFEDYILKAKKTLDFKIHSLIINKVEEKNQFSDSYLFYKTK